MKKIFTPIQDTKVLVKCMSYNHSKYIEDALNGFAMQKTDFPFVCLVMDDASTDGEQNVIKDWMERECDMSRAENVEIEKSLITIVPHKANEFCTLVFYFLKINLYGTDEKKALLSPWLEHCEYIALCEGDDYWIDSNKMKKQVDYLDSHKDCSLCFHGAEVLNEVTHRYDNMFDFLEFREYSSDEIFERWTIPTASVVYRSEHHKLIPTDKDFLYGDIVCFMTMASKGKLMCIKDKMSVYRRTPSGAVLSVEKNSVRRKQEQLHYVALKKYFPIDDSIFNKMLNKAKAKEIIRLWKEKQIMCCINTYSIYCKQDAKFSICLKKLVISKLKMKIRRMLHSS